MQLKINKKLTKRSRIKNQKSKIKRMKTNIQIYPFKGTALKF